MATASLLFAGLANATPTNYQGSFTADDQHYVVPINLTGAGTLSAFTTSWALGGFAPVLTLFGGAGGYQQAVGSSMTCGAGSGAPDPATGFCWDANFSTSLLAGNYLLVLTQDGNLANGDTLADGFAQDGISDYTAQSYLGASTGALCVNVDASQRSCDFALTVDVKLDAPAPPAAVPEPASLPLFGLAALALAGVRRLRRR